MKLIDRKNLEAHGVAAVKKGEAEPLNVNGQRKCSPCKAAANFLQMLGLKRSRIIFIDASAECPGSPSKNRAELRFWGSRYIFRPARRNRRSTPCELCIDRRPNPEVDFDPTPCCQRFHHKSPLLESV